MQIANLKHLAQAKKKVCLSSAYLALLSHQELIGDFAMEFLSFSWHFKHGNTWIMFRNGHLSCRNMKFAMCSANFKQQPGVRKKNAWLSLLSSGREVEPFKGFGTSSPLVKNSTSKDVFFIGHLI